MFLILDVDMVHVALGAGPHPPKAVWQPASQKSGVVPQKPNLLQHTFKGHSPLPVGAHRPHSAPYLLGICDNLHDVQQACRAPPGGAYVLPDPIGAPTAGTYYTTAQPALPTQSGTIADCGRYYDVVERDICQMIAMRHGISLEQLFAYNRYLTRDCMNLWAKSSVCVAQALVPPVSTDGHCGPEFAYATCGEELGTCCSSAGKCGSTEAECAAGWCYSGEDGSKEWEANQLRSTFGWW
ncbi:hypothetical protein ACEQ8H_003001 [Pleosporales sp. CAS-2024a]